MNYEQKVKDFLNQKSIAIAGVSRNPQGSVGNPIYKKFKENGYNIFPVNPNAEMIEGDKCYPNLKSIPEKVDAVFIATSPAISTEIVKQSIDAGVKTIWFHRSMGNGSFSEEAAKLGEGKGITVIRSGCPMMYISKVDPFHKMMRFFMKLFGKLK
ncbi:MAG: CoA-binding protein [Ignavibacteriales bacterium]|nr:CoA-binding protein [Ignavibacteriales bacterium]